MGRVGNRVGDKKRGGLLYLYNVVAPILCDQSCFICGLHVGSKQLEDALWHGSKLRETSCSCC